MIIFYCVAIFECCSHRRCFWLLEWIYCFSCYRSGRCEVVFKSSLPLKKCVVSINRYVSLIKLTIVFIITTWDKFFKKLSLTIVDAQRPRIDAWRPRIDARRPRIDARRPRINAVGQGLTPGGQGSTPGGKGSTINLWQNKKSLLEKLSKQKNSNN